MSTPPTPTSQNEVVHTPIVRSAKVLWRRRRTAVIITSLVVFLVVLPVISGVIISLRSKGAPKVASTASATVSKTAAKTARPSTSPEPTKTEAAKPAPTTAQPEKTQAPATQEPTQAPKPAPSTTTPPKPSSSGEKDVSKEVECSEQCTVTATAKADSQVTLEFSVRGGAIKSYEPIPGQDPDKEVGIKVTFNGKITFHATGSGGVTVETDR